MKEVSIAYRVKGKEKYPPLPTKGIIHEYISGNKTKCGIQMDSTFAVVHYFTKNITCKKCLKKENK